MHMNESHQILNTWGNVLFLILNDRYIGIYYIIFLTFLMSGQSVY